MIKISRYFENPFDEPGTFDFFDAALSARAGDLGATVTP